MEAVARRLVEMQSFSGQKRVVSYRWSQIFESNGLAQSVEVMKARREKF